ncbi:MAG TPA: hypothetical protein VFO85_15665 [Vicinamibacteria bacterium]|nr:hypothetical protein [Vicinamibacteria bacterium]
MPHLIEPATTGRARCRGCGAAIAAGQLRFGEGVPNPFGDGETRHWFHLDCAAFKRPQPFLETLDAAPAAAAAEEAQRLRAEAQRGMEHERLTRINGAERDKSGRAQCRSCRTTIAKGAWRLTLVFYEEGRFSAAGFLHPGCAREYFDTTDVMPRIRRFSPDLGEAEVAEIAAELEGAGPVTR